MPWHECDPVTSITGIILNTIKLSAVYIVKPLHAPSDTMSNTNKTAKNTEAEGNFRVPEGYFEEFCNRIASHPSITAVPLAPLRSRSLLTLRLRMAAAALVASVVGLAVYSTTQHQADVITADATHNSTPLYNESNVDRMLDYVMYDDDDLYACLFDD